ncbi:energy-coupling factor ABC transporter ATP-binding protein [Anaeromicropila herbilytica]|uniref:ABC transporter ATP-binding protein n=1 Tax=Anaeromicropila herbilytica TaxID=2785025 RepID=A0A7R7IFW1_9FIRM|nr:ABC transporter ATP-binding protein [Anaeromicropila herbilytica]BCN32483.1 ABC transporter ATP-binding protein [Anaeromicropila herbilytica]
MSKITVTNLKYKYPHRDNLALNNISFEIQPGEFIGIVGENNSGKSTLCQSIIGLVPHFYKGGYGGSVIIDDIEVYKSDISTLCKKVGLIFQNPFNQVTGSKETVFEEIAFGLENIGIPRDEMIERINFSMKLLDIEQYKDRNPFDLSGGQMQRVAIASIIAMKPEIIILDEPTSQLDPAGSEEVFQAVTKLSNEGITIIMVEHKIEKIAAYCDKVMLMHKGELIKFDTPSEVFSLDNLSDYGINPPIFTSICKKLNLRKDDNNYPVTIEETLQLLKKERSYEQN